MNNKYLILFSLILITNVGCKKENSLRIENERESGSTVSLRNFKRDAFNEKGELIWILKAKEAFVYANTNKSIFYGLDFDQYDKGKVNSRLKSDRGEIDQKEKKLVLSGNIDLITDDSKHLKAEGFEVIGMFAFPFSFVHWNQFPHFVGSFVWLIDFNLGSVVCRTLGNFNGSVIS